MADSCCACALFVHFVIKLPVHAQRFFFFDRTDTEKMVDALRDLRVKHLENCKAKTAEAFQELYNAARDQVW